MTVLSPRSLPPGKEINERLSVAQGEAVTAAGYYESYGHAHSSLFASAVSMGILTARPAYE